MDMKALFKVQNGLFVAAVGTPEKLNGCVTNTLMQQSHVPVKFSVTIEKSHLTHDMIRQKGSLGISVLSKEITVATIRRFGFASGRDVDKFQDFDGHTLDANGNPLLTGPEIAARFSLRVYDSVDMGTHTMYLCTPDAMENGEGGAITYSEYQQSLKKKK